MTKVIHPCPKFIASQIKYWRKKKAVTQLKLSQSSGVKLRHLQKIEAGQVDMKLHTLGAISQGLDTLPHILLTPVVENRNNMCRKCLFMLPNKGS